MENGLHVPSSEPSSASLISTRDDVEVKKLKDLVKKLEKQNEHLRHRTGKLSSNASKLVQPKLDSYVGGGDAVGNHHSRKCSALNGNKQDLEELKVVDENDPIVRSTLNGDELSWLYQSPKTSAASDDKYSSPVDWLKDEFENPSSPQLATAKRNILYKMGMPITDWSSPDLSYVTRSIEKRILFPSDDDVASGSGELKKAATPPLDDAETFPSNTPTSLPHQAPGSPPPTHHLPLPSQTMTTAHGLFPAHFDEDSTNPRGRRSHTPTPLGASPRAKSPARPRQANSPARRNLASPRVPPPRSISPLRASNPQSRPNERKLNPSSNQLQPSIRSSLVAPGRMSRLQQRSGLPSPTSSSGIPSASSRPSPRAPSPMTSQRRTLPRPSQTSMRYSRLSAAARASNPSPRAPSPSDVWGDDEVY